MPTGKSKPANGSGHSSAVRMAVLEQEVEGVKDRMDDLELTVKEGFRAVGDAGREQSNKIDRLLSQTSATGKLSWPQIGTLVLTIMAVGGPILVGASFYVRSIVSGVHHEVEVNRVRRENADTLNRLADEAAWSILQSRIETLPPRPGATP